MSKWSDKNKKQGVQRCHQCWALKSVCQCAPPEDAQPPAEPVPSMSEFMRDVLGIDVVDQSPSGRWMSRMLDSFEDTNPCAEQLTWDPVEEAERILRETY